MTMKQKHEELEPPKQSLSSFGYGDVQQSGGDAADGTVERSAFCRHGIHHGRFPVVGLTIGEARRTLNELLRIGPDTVAVVNGEIVDDEYVIGEDVKALNFIKASSIKGSRTDLQTGFRSNWSRRRPPNSVFRRTFGLCRTVAAPTLRRTRR